MRSVGSVLQCTWNNFLKWRANPTVWIVGGLCFVLAVWNMSWVLQFCIKTNTRISMWVFPGLFSFPATVTLYFGSVLVLFSNAPFDDSHTPFLMIRTGKRDWILGQLVYIYLTAAVLPLAHYACMLLVLLPRLGFTMEWGGVITSVAGNTELIQSYGITPSGYLFSSYYVQNYTPLAATLQTFLQTWMVTAFFGILILFFNVVCKPGVGVLVAGVMVFIGAFASMIGSFYFPGILDYIAVTNWVDIHYLAPFSVHAPTLPQAMYILAILILLMSAVTGIVFCNKDYNIQKTR